MRKKILIVTDNISDQVNGVVTTFTNIELLARRDGFDIDYISPVLFNSIAAPGYPEVRLAWPRRIGRAIQAQRPDYIHIATEGPVGLAARLWLDRQGWRYNTSYHTKFPEFLKRIYGIPECITYAYVRWFHKHSGQVLTTTETMVRDLRARGFSDNIKSWSRGVDRDIFVPQPRIQPNDPVILLSAGRVSKEKNLDEFCKISYPNSRKIVVGDGPYRQELESKYPDVEFVGAKKGKKLAEYYSAADVFVFTSKTDTFGIVMIEALASGTPIAAYPVPGPIDIIEPGVTGFVSNDLAEAIGMCLGYDRNRVAEASQCWTWQRCWEIFRDNLVEIV